jgi:hypothetical protein
MNATARAQLTDEQHRRLRALVRGERTPHVQTGADVEHAARDKLHGHVRRLVADLFPVTAQVTPWDAALVARLASLGKTTSNGDAADEAFRLLRPLLRRMRRGATRVQLLALERAIVQARGSEGVRVDESALAVRLATRLPTARADLGPVFLVRASRALIEWYAPTRTTLLDEGSRLGVAAVYKDADSGVVRIAIPVRPPAM